MTESFSDFMRVLFSRNFTFVKFRKNKALSKNFEFTVGSDDFWELIPFDES